MSHGPPMMTRHYGRVLLFLFFFYFLFIKYKKKSNCEFLIVNCELKTPLQLTNIRIFFGTTHKKMTSTAVEAIFQRVSEP